MITTSVIWGGGGGGALLSSSALGVTWNLLFFVLFVVVLS